MIKIKHKFNTLSGPKLLLITLILIVAPLLLIYAFAFICILIFPNSEQGLSYMLFFFVLMDYPFVLLVALFTFIIGIKRLISPIKPKIVHPQIPKPVDPKDQYKLNL